MHMQSVGDGQVSVTVMFSDDPSEVCGLSCLVTGPEGLDDAGRALIPAVSATLESDARAESEDEELSFNGGLVGAACSCCGNPIVWVDPGEAVDPVCPVCSARKGTTEKLSHSLALTRLQMRLDEVVGDAPVETATELVPVLAELDRINSAIAEELPTQG
jgi:hypothetical protein